MRNVAAVLIVCVGLAFAGQAQDKGKKPKGQLPAGWKKLDLSKEQIGKIYTIRSDYKAKIMALQKQITGLRAEEKTALIAVLSAQQKALLRKLTIGDDDTPPKKKPADSSK